MLFNFILSYTKIKAGIILPFLIYIFKIFFVYFTWSYTLII
uniref:Uncharacterized protein n=1 Tax=Siphoviridae sp. ct6rT12 TaxID=2825346 RepID=A0A8S5V9D7_9CAUD|nr:MAG TPA: hypothetical protein [Siphoviridae sp. ct6rT12]DAI56955.1 MAG TPA: hypothetical protein [Bacteriophage sp.]